MIGSDSTERIARRGDRVRDRGTIAVALMLLVLVTFAGTGLVVDGGRSMAARRHASNIAEAAARSAVTTAGPLAVIEPRVARAAALQVTTAAGVPAADVTIDVQADVVIVTVVERRKAVFAVLAGQSTFTVRASGRARVRFIP